jgi:uncharacterized repeat protein (TIGR03803 family)
MKTNQMAFPLAMLIACLGAMALAGRVRAQTFTTLHNFTTGNNNPAFGYTNTDGVNPSASLILSGNTLYGPAGDGGSFGKGTLFKVDTNGTGFLVLHAFTGASDGGGPNGNMILCDNTLYGTTYNGVFKINTNGTEFAVVYKFTSVYLNTNITSYYPYTNNDGNSPVAGVVLSDDALYGTAQYGGIAGNGTVFKVNTNGTGFAALHSFSALSSSGNSAPTNSDGAQPVASLSLSGNTLYGTAQLGGGGRSGTVFSVNKDGTGFKILHSFESVSGPSPSTNSEGGFPAGRLIISGTTVYGAATGGGSSGNGTLFKVDTNGAGFTALHVFVGNDGRAPGEIVLSGNTLYGTTARGGISGNGTVFAVSTDGTGFRVIHDFAALTGSAGDAGKGTNTDGAIPYAGLFLSGDTLYGGAYEGGNSGNGTIFSLTLPVAVAPQLTLIPSAGNSVLTWPTNAVEFTLQSATNLGPTAIWTTNSPAPVVVNGLNTVTNPISGTQEFFRLSQ